MSAKANPKEAQAGDAAEAAPVDVSILKPLIEDQPLISLIKARFVPLFFLLKKVQSRPTPEVAMEVVQALTLLRGDSPRASANGLYGLEAQFYMINNIVQVGSARNKRRQSGELLPEVTMAHVKATLTPESRQASKAFGEKFYQPLMFYYERYVRVVREAERVTDIKEALVRAKISQDDWDIIKSWMGRYGLVNEVPLAKPILLFGPVAKEIEQRFLGERVEDVVEHLLRQALGIAKTVPAGN